MEAPPNERDAHRPVRDQPYRYPDREEVNGEGSRWHRAGDPRNNSRAQQQPDKQSLGNHREQAEQRRPVLLPAPLHDEVVDALPADAEYGDGGEYHEVVAVHDRQRRRNRKYRADDKGDQPADYGEQHKPGLDPAA